jgi:hypothetical protein
MVGYKRFYARHRVYGGGCGVVSHGVHDMVLEIGVDDEQGKKIHRA